MPKRDRASRSSHRPGGQGPSRTRKSSDGATPEEEFAAAPAEAGLTGPGGGEVEVDEIAAAAVAATATTAAPAAPSDPRTSRRRDRRRSRQRPGDLAARAGTESVWVRADLRRIAVVSVILLAALAASWIVFGLVDVLSLY